jgi:hypothetical protein
VAESGVPGSLSHTEPRARRAAPPRAVVHRTFLLVATLLLAAPLPAQPTPLRVRGADGAWQAWWRADRAPARWTAPQAAVAAAARWRVAAPGLEVAELTLATPGEGGLDALGRVRVVVARLDPARHHLRLAAGSPPGAPWRVDDAPSDARLALNAGQFTDAGPWGWLVHGGRELQAPATGPLSAALVVGADGAVRIVTADELPAARLAARRGEVAEAVQSYPTLLAGDGEVPMQLRAPGRGVDLGHRDARLAVGLLPDGRLLVALTRFDAVRGDDGARGPLEAVLGALDRVPLGLTVPEMAAVMGALGCRRAVLLDGGLSAQLLVRDTDGAARAWPGTRRVPLGLVALPRAPETLGAAVSGGDAGGGRR